MIRDLLLLFLVLFIMLSFYLLPLNGELVKSQTDGRYYLVKATPDKQAVADLMGTINLNNIKLINYLKTLPDNTRYERLIKRYPNVKLEENIRDPNYTSYSLNKGELIAVCVRSKTSGNLHDINLIMYVVIHELAHILNKTYGHDSNFQECFKLLLQHSEKCGIYKPINFKTNPTEYCGMIIKNGN